MYIHIAWGTVLLSLAALAAFMSALWLQDAFGRLVERVPLTSVVEQARRASAVMGFALLAFMVVMLGVGAVFGS